MMNKINKSLGKERLFELNENNKEILGDLNSYIPDLMNRLWENPEIIATIIENTDINDLKQYIAPLFVDNFYENVFSSNYIEENLIYIFTLLIKSEINKLNDINHVEIFLNNTPCGIMLEEFIQNGDIQQYLDKITKNFIANLVNNYSKRQILFDPSQISLFLNEKNSNEENHTDKKLEQAEKE